MQQSKFLGLMLISISFRLSHQREGIYFYSLLFVALTSAHCLWRVFGFIFDSIIFGCWKRSKTFSVQTVKYCNGTCSKVWGRPEVENPVIKAPLCCSCVPVSDFPANKKLVNFTWHSNRRMTPSLTRETAARGVHIPHTLLHTSSWGRLFKSPSRMLIKLTFTAKLNFASSGAFCPLGFMKCPGMFAALLGRQ